MNNHHRNRPDWGHLFRLLLEQPGVLGEHYRLFHNYSLTNQALAIVQMQERGLPLGPISTFNGWRKLGRQVRKGEKALFLWMPITVTDVIRHPDGTEEHRPKKIFMFRPRWFTLAQTEPIEGAEAQVSAPPAPEAWDKAKALATLGIKEIPFDEVNGNVQGFARPDSGQVAVSPIAAFPWKTLFHEMAHCLLHKGAGAMSDGDRLEQSLVEAEAEAVAYLCCATLGLPGLDEARGYVQWWLGGAARADAFRARAKAVFQAADAILKAGTKEVRHEDG